MKPTAPFECLEATVDSVHAAMRSGQLTCQQLVDAYLKRIAAYDQKGPALNAIQTLNPHALEEAKALDTGFRQTGTAGPLHGIPIVVKDQVETSDMPTTFGSALFRDFVPRRDATIVQKIKAAGGIILAKTTMGEFAAGYAGSAFGACRNAYDPGREPSGSSSGSGVAVAANFAMLGVGEDTLGSIRGPAARNSLVGLRPTVPLVSRFGMMPAAPTRDTLGPIARTVRDAAILLDVLAGYDHNDPITAYSVGHVPTTYTSFLDPDGLRGTRVGVIREPMAKDADPDAADFREIRGVVDRALRDMGSQGAGIVDPISIPSLRELLEATSGTFEEEESINSYLAAHPNAPIKTLQEIVLSSDVIPSRRIRLMQGLGHTTDDPGFLHHLQVREQLRLAVLKAMADARLDALVYATFDHDPTPIPADIMTASSRSQPGSNRTLSVMIGAPAITVPAGFTADGLPVGIEFLGRPFSEGVLLKIAYGYEQTTHHRRPPATAPALPDEP